MYNLKNEPRISPLVKPRPNIRWQIWGVIVAVTIALTIILELCFDENSPEFSGFAEAYTQGTVSDAIFYAVEDEYLPQLGFEAMYLEDWTAVEEARNAYSFVDTATNNIYTYYIGNKAGRCEDLEAYVLTKNDVEEGRGIVSSDVNGTRVEIVIYYYRREYLIRIENDRIKTDSLITFDFEPCDKVFPSRPNAENYEIVLQYVSKSDIAELVREYEAFTDRTLQSLQSILSCSTPYLLHGEVINFTKEWYDKPAWSILIQRNSAIEYLLTKSLQVI